MSGEEKTAALGCGCAAGVVLLVVLYALAMANVEYGEGHRDGEVQKLSHKGFIWKTYEGELATAGFKLRPTGDGSSGGNAWEFSVIDVKVFAELNDLPAGARVRLYYRQYWATLPWLGATTYRVYKVKVLDNK